MDDVASLVSDRERRWRRWVRWWMLASTPGVVLAVLLWGLEHVLEGAIVPGVVGVALWVRVRSAAAEGLPPPGQLIRRGSRVALQAGCGGVSLVALGTVSVSAAMLVLGLLGLSSPPAASQVRRVVEPAPTDDSAGRLPPPPQHPLLSVLVAGPPAGLTQAQLCRAWRQSFLALSQTRTLAEHACVVDLRQAYLDELERRDGAALRRWLHCGARAAEGPDLSLPDDGPPRSDGGV